MQCTDPALLLIEAWTPPSVWTPPRYDEDEIFSLPTYQSCLQSYTDLSFEFLDSSNQLLSWIEANTGTNQISVTLSKSVFLAYLDTTITVTIRAIDMNDPTRINDEARFSIDFDR